MNAKIEEAFNRQINAEIFSSYLYLSMASYFATENMAGMAQWMQIQAQEELAHAMKFFNFINDREGRVVLTQIEAPQTEWESPAAAFADAFEHEQEVSALINGLVDLAIAEKDHAANTFLQWFVTEQVEEEASAKSIVDKLKLVGNNHAALFMMDGQLGQRTGPAPAASPAE